MKTLFAVVGCAFASLGYGYAQVPDTLLAVRQTVGTSKVTRLSLHTNGGLYLGGEYDAGLPTSSLPVEGSGTRLIWYPGKAAFRAGSVNGTQWDDANIGLYSVAMGVDARALGDYAMAVGRNVTASNVGTVALGQFCTATGANSVALGYHSNTSTGAGAPRQGTFVFADRSVVDNNSSTDYSDEFSVEVNHSAMWRVTGGFRVVTGGSTLSSFGYVPSRGVSILPVSFTGSGSNVGTTNWGQTAALIATSSGAYLSDGGTWTNSSDRRRKHLFEAVSGEDVLARLRQVPITRWSYRADAPAVRHLGPVAQDFHRAFGLGHDSVSIGTVDADGVALAGVQALDARTRAQAAQLTALQTQLRALQADNLALRTQLNQSPGGEKRDVLLAAVAFLTALAIGSRLLLRRSVA